MFCVVRYGDKQSLLVNPQCSVPALLRHMKDKCGVPPEIEIDLAEEQTGTVKDLQNKRDLYADEMLITRTVYVLVAVQARDEGGDEETHRKSKNIFLPLLADYSLACRLDKGKGRARKQHSHGQAFAKDGNASDDSSFARGTRRSRPSSSVSSKRPASKHSTKQSSPKKQ